MFIDFSETTVQIDPYRDVESLNIQIQRHTIGDGVFYEGDLETTLPTESDERISVGTRTFDVQVYCLTKHEEVTQLQEQEGANFRISSQYMDADNEWRVRHISLGLIQRETGWAVELMQDELVQDPRLFQPVPAFSIFLPLSFRPTFGTPVPEPIPEVVEPGRPIWERLTEDS